MSFIYPRVVSITRPAVLSGVGAQSYQGLNPATETTIATGVPASIQRSSSSKLLVDMPANAAGATTWNIFLYTLTNGTVKDRDIITDDLNIRYQVKGAYWDSLGYKCECERLET